MPEFFDYTDFSRQDPKALWLQFRAGETPSSTEIHQDFFSQVPTGARVLDVGCASGKNSFRLALQGYEVHGIDINPREVGSNQDFSRDKDYYPHFALASATDLPHQDGSFDAAAMLGLLGGIGIQDRIATVREAARVLRPGGLLYTAQFARINEREWQDVYREHQRYTGEYGSLLVGRDGPTPFIDHHFQPRELQLLLAENGFRATIKSLRVASTIPNSTHTFLTYCAFARKV